VRSYHTTQPPIHLSHDANSEASNDTILGSRLLSSLLRRTSVVAGTMMLYFGTINIRLQKMVITVSQPLILAGICWMYYEVAHAQWIVIFPCLGVLLFLGYQFWHHSKAGSSGDGKIGVAADDDASSKEHSKQSRSLDSLSLRRIHPHDQHEEANRRSEQLEVASSGGAGEEVRRMEAVAGSIPVPGIDDTVHGVNRGVTSAGIEHFSDTQSFEVDNYLDEEESFRLMIESYFNGESTPPTPPPAAAAAAAVVSEEDRDEGGGYDEGWSDGQNAWDVEMPDHISLE
jgi:hypothetical protein